MPRLSLLRSAHTKATTIGIVLLLAGACATGASAGRSAERDEEFARDRVLKRFTDVDFQLQLASEMVVRKVQYAGADDMIVPAYLFMPRDTVRKHATIIMVHEDLHGDFKTLYVPELRALVSRGYIVIAPEYRGSTGYGREYYEAIDYGGKEVEDVIQAHDFLSALVPSADVSRLGIMGWSHGGFITLHAIFRRPELFKAAVAVVPVADLAARMKNHDADYHRLFASQKAYGGTIEQNPKPYLERSPVTHARELKVPLLVHAADNDSDVFIVENHNLRDSMVVAGKDTAGLYTYKEWHDPPGGHQFSRVDTPQARESWTETLAFLDARLHPER
ncbi:MAG TPA: alpha/beta fold hydrolase [Gemmatimonadaceae bacterium]|nr:alpha/beta fold hydrolase [Gemmatimonadaceae bacterium]